LPPPALEPGRALLGATGTAPTASSPSSSTAWSPTTSSVLRIEWQALPETENFADVRRLYRYLWVIYSLLMTIFGAQQILRYIFFVPTGLLGEMTRETIVNGLALLLIGTPLWVYTWNAVQRSLTDEQERDSNLRLTILYILALGGVITVLTAAAMVLPCSAAAGASMPA
jgi:hypothetical protein